MDTDDLGLDLQLDRRRFIGLTGAGVAGATLGFAAHATEPVYAQGQEINPAPDRRRGEGKGPFKKLVIRGGTLIDGTGAPPRGPVDIVVTDNKIAQIRDVHPDDLAKRRPPFNANHEIDATDMFVLPGFIDCHVHAGGPPKNPDAEYPYKLWLAHGVTTVRGVNLGSYAFSLSERQRSERNEIVAPRIFNYQRPGDAWGQGPVNNAERARAWVKWLKENGGLGIKFRSGGHLRPDIFGAVCDEAAKQGLGTTAHLDQQGVLQTNAIQAARLGVGSITHFYGHMESLLRPGEQLFPPEYDYSKEEVRFSQVSDWVNKIHPVGGPEWKAYLEENLQLGTVFDPTFNIYVAGRDVMRMRTAEWHKKYTLPSLFEFFQPAVDAHGSYYWDWGTEVETAWKRFYQVWFQLVKDYHEMGGRITTGTDSGFIYQTYGFAFPLEMELLREAGLQPLDVVKAATLDGAKTLYEPMGIDDPPIGSIKEGKDADILVVPENPITDITKPEWARRGGGFKTLYGTGHERLNEQEDRLERVGGVKWTIKDGIVYDARRLLADVARMVKQQKGEREGVISQLTRRRAGP